MPPYPYQEQVKSLILSGKSVVLQAPTGAGKTRAALAPFIEAFFDLPPEAFPRKCIYSVPMRVLANQFFAEYRNLTASYRRKHHQELTVSIQTGDRPDDTKLESNLIFSTIDQTLSSFLNIPHSLGTGSANLNAGAILSSFLVFDELHLYDPDTMLPTTLEMLRMIKGIIPFIVMTATFSSQMLERLARLFDAVIVPGDQQARKQMEEIGSQVGKSRSYYTVDRPLSPEVVLDPMNRAQRTICICNTVGAAQNLYRSIQRALESHGDHQTQLCLLHSRFYKDDRDLKEKWIKDKFEVPQAEYEAPPLILIATQVIEVGVNATCDVMHTELAPAASILQRAGRCARRENETGKVFVYLPRDQDGEPDYTPYFLKNQRRKTERGLRLCQATWEALNSGAFSGKHISFQLEQELIDQVHMPIDREILEGIEAKSNLHRDHMIRVMQEYDRGSASELVRDVDSRFVIIHPYPEKDENLVRNPWYYDGFSFSPGSLAKAFTQLQETTEEEQTPWIMKAASQADAESVIEDEESPARQIVEYLWYSLADKQEIFRSPVIAIHPSEAHYDSEIGIVIEPSTFEYLLHRRSRHPIRKNFSYRKETYAEHIAGLYAVYQKVTFVSEIQKFYLPLKDEIDYAVCRMEERYHLSSGTVDRMIRGLFACHDLGKLNLSWQKWAHQWQALVGQFYEDVDMSLPKNYLAAHTDFDGSMEQKSLQRKLGKRPRHAGESAIAASELLESVCDDNEHLWRAGMTAIARHHSARTEDYTHYKYHSLAANSIAEALQMVELPTKLSKIVLWEDDGKKNLQNALVSFNNCSELMLYFLLVRILRLADQRSQLYAPL